MILKTKVGLLALALSGSVFLFSCGDKNNKKTTPSKSVVNNDDSTTIQNEQQSLKIAFVNADTLNSKYQYLKDKEAAFEKKQSAYEAEMTNKQKAFQNEAIAFQKKIQDGQLTQSEGESLQKKLESQQTALERRHQEISTQLAKEQATIQEDFQKKLDDFLEQFNKEYGYDFILTYSKNGGALLYGSKSYDITQQVLDAMNEAYKNGGSKATTK
ncbi:MAG TPA: OmpH family outer membrane protein [Edaphocola sp.]|nr:OmpH family outer membrane protein [Edaphocola sp.]